MEYLIWCLTYISLSPLIGLAIGFIIAVTGDFKEKFKEILIFLYPYHFVVALYQLILSIIFLCNNYPFLLTFDTILGISLPIFLISCIFSGGSILKGIYTMKVTLIDDD